MKNNNNCPATGKPYEDKKLTPNQGLKSKIIMFKEERVVEIIGVVNEILKSC